MSGIRPAIFFAVACLSVCALGFDNSETSSEVSVQKENAANRLIRAKLLKHTTFDFKFATLEEIVAFLETQHDLQVEVDYKNLRENQYDPKDAFNAKADDTELWNALKSVLAQHRLRCYVDQGKFKIASSNFHYTVSYRVEDILQSSKSFDAIIKLVESNVQPSTWKVNGGMGDMAPFETNKTLVISNTQEVHEQVADLLQQVRAKKFVPAKQP